MGPRCASITDSTTVWLWPCAAPTPRSRPWGGVSWAPIPLCPTPRRAPNAVVGSGPVLDPSPKSFPHRLDVVEGSVRELAQALDQVVGRAHAPSACDDHRPVSRERGRLEVAGQLGPSLDLV